MYTIYFYKTKDGKRPAADYITELKGKTDKDSRINLNKIQDYINALSEHGLQLKEPYIKHLDGKIWELRPLRNRIFFTAWRNGSFVLLHSFIKKTQKTPAGETEKAKREFEDLTERGIDDEQQRDRRDVGGTAKRTLHAGGNRRQQSESFSYRGTCQGEAGKRHKSEEA